MEPLYLTPHGARVSFHDRPTGVQYSLSAGDFESSTVFGGVVRFDGDVANSVFLGLVGEQYGICLDAQSSIFENNTVVGCADSVALRTYIARNNIVAHSAGVGIEAGHAVANLTWDNDGGDWSGTDWSSTLGNISAGA